MALRQSPEEFLSAVEAAVRSGEWPSNEALRSLVALCDHPREGVRERAAALLLAPPAIDESACFAHLLNYLAGHTPRMDRLPRAIAEFVRDTLAFLIEPPVDPSLRSLFDRALKRLGKQARLNSPALSLDAVVRICCACPFADTRNVFESRTLKRRWRLFRKRFLAFPPPPLWAEPTTADLEPLRRQPGTSRRLHFNRARWLAVLRPLLLPLCRSVPDGKASDEADERTPLFAPLKGGMVTLPRFRDLQWNGRGPAALLFLEALTRRQAEELRSIRDLAVRVSRSTRRVVLSWHNATLAAAGGWAFEPLGAQFPRGPLFEEFRRAVELRAGDIEEAAKRNPAEIEALAGMREKRLLIPKLTHALWESRIRSVLDAGRKDRWEADVQAAKPYLSAEMLEEIEEGAKFGWHGAVSPHQRVSVRGVLAEWEGGRERFMKGLALLAALAFEGRKLMDEGRLEYFVLPWIDKFFISSLRRTDCEYLPALVRMLENLGSHPLALFFEDTAHGRAPSFQLALERMIGRGHPFRGIGVFGDGTDGRADAEAVILREHRNRSLFALRPLDDRHTPCTLHRLLDTLDWSFFRSYDSSWKDNLCFLYSGTQVFPLLSVQCEPEPFAARASGGGVRFPFGAAFRVLLRREVLGPVPDAGDPLSLRYALWANLT